MLIQYFQVITLLFFPLVAGAQSLSVSVLDNTSRNSASTFLLDDRSVFLSDQQIKFLNSGTVVSQILDYGVTPDHSFIGLLSNASGSSSALIVNAEGDTLSQFEVTKLNPDDPSVGVYPFNTGEVVIRDNIASFSFYDSFGNIVTRVSSSTQSKGGEAISELAFDPQGETVVIYNPKVKRNGSVGSRAQLLTDSNKLEHIFSDSDDIIKYASVSDDGQFIVLVTGGGDATAVIMDRFGNELNSISIGKPLNGARLSEGARYITLFSEGRVLVFNTLNGERLGSASLRAPILTANYFPKDDIILGVTGSRSASGNIVHDVNFHAIHIGKRKIAREDLGAGLGVSDAIQLKLRRRSAGQYILEGGSKRLLIRASF